MNGRRRELLGLALLVAAIGAVRLAEIRPGHEWGCDFAMYVMEAENLAAGRPYAETGYIVNPHYRALGPQTYPAGYPLLIAPLYAAVGEDFTAFKLEMLGCLLVALVLVYFNFRDDLGPWGAGLVVALFGFNHYLHGWVNSLGSDLPFVLWMYAGLLAVHAAYRGRDGQSPRVGLLVLAGVLFGMTYVTRSLGVVLIPALWGQDLVRNRWRPTAGVVLATAVFAAIVALQTMFLHSDSAYASLFDLEHLAITYNTVEYTQRLILFWDNGYVKALAVPLFLITAPAVAVGYLARLLRGPSIYEFLPLIYLPLVIFFPGYQGVRYILPLLPLYLYWLVGGGQWLLQVFQERTRRRLLAVLGGAVAASYLATFTTLEWGPMREGIERRESRELFDHVRRETPEDAVVVFVKPRAMALLADRRSTAWHKPASDEALLEYWASVGATHAVAVRRTEAFHDFEDPALVDFTREFVARHPERFEEVFSNGDFALYRIKPAAG